MPQNHGAHTALHLFECRETAPLWRACIQFCTDILGTPRPKNMRDAILFGMASLNVLLPEEARAFLRHAYNCFYHDFANVDLKDLQFIWQITFAHATRSFQDAVLRYGMKLRILFNTRMCSTLQGVAPPWSTRTLP